MNRVKPATEAHRQELQAEVSLQKQRLMSASRSGLDILKTDLSLATWLRSYPKESAALIMMGGYIAAKILRARRQKLTQAA